MTLRYIVVEDRCREMGGIVETMQTLANSDGIILTWGQDEIIVLNGNSIRVLPVWRQAVGIRIIRQDSEQE